MVAHVNARIEYASRPTSEVVHIETVSIVDAAVKFIALRRMWIETFLVANYSVVRRFCRAVGATRSS